MSRLADTLAQPHLHINQMHFGWKDVMIPDSAELQIILVHLWAVLYEFLSQYNERDSGYVLKFAFNVIW